MKTASVLPQNAESQFAGHAGVLAEEDIRSLSQSKSTTFVALKDADDDCDCVEED